MKTTPRTGIVPSISPDLFLEAVQGISSKIVELVLVLYQHMVRFYERE
jgi:hypothetical protein